MGNLYDQRSVSTLSDAPGLHKDTLHFAGINVGRGHVKVKTDAHYFQYASIVQRSQQGLGRHGLLEAAIQRVQVDGVTYDVGEEAALVGERAVEKLVFSNWGTSHLYRVLMQAVLDNLAQESPGPWVVMLGMPVDEYKDEAYRQRLTTLWQGRHASARGSLAIDWAAATPEPLGSFWHYAMVHPEREVHLANQMVTIVDFGYFTTDINAVNRMRLHASVANSVHVGMRDVYRIMGDLIQRKHRKACTDIEVEMAVLGRWPMMKRGMPLDVTEELSIALGHVGERIMQWVRACADRADGLVLTTGGGAPLLTAQVQATLPEAKVEMLRDPQQANAHGYWYMAQALSDVP